MVGDAMICISVLFSIIFSWIVENISLVVVGSYLVLSAITACIFERLGGGAGNPEKYLVIGLCWPAVIIVLIAMGFVWIISKFKK